MLVLLIVRIYMQINGQQKPKRPGSPFYLVKIPISPMLKLQRSQSPTVLCGSPWNCDDILSYVYSPDKGPSFFEFHYRKENISNSNMQNCVFAYFIVLNWWYFRIWNEIRKTKVPCLESIHRTRYHHNFKAIHAELWETDFFEVLTWAR